jgi:hypothetical protein
MPALAVRVQARFVWSCGGAIAVGAIAYRRSDEREVCVSVRDSARIPEPRCAAGGATPIAFVRNVSDHALSQLRAALPHWTFAADGCEWPSHVTIVGLPAWAQSATNLVQVIRHMAAAYADTPFAILMRLDDSDARSIVRSHTWDATALMFQGIDDQGGSAEIVLAGARAICLARQVDRSFAEPSPQWIRSMFVRTIAHALSRLRVPALATTLGVSERTLEKRLHNLGLPPAREVIPMGQTLAGIDLVASGFCTIAKATSLMNFRQTRTTRENCRAFFGGTLGDVARRGAGRALTRITALVIEAAERRPGAWERERERERERESARARPRARAPRASFSSRPHPVTGRYRDRAERRRVSALRRHAKIRGPPTQFRSGTKAKPFPSC